MPGCLYDPNRGPTQGGLLPYPPSQQRRLRPKPCTWRSAAAYACRSRSATADADRHTAVGHKSTDSVTTRSLAREPARSLHARGAGGAAQWLFHTTAPGVRAEDRRRLDFVIYGATPDGSALCCDATLVSPLTRTGPQPCAADVDGAALRTAERRKAATYPELHGAGPQKLVVLGSEVGGRFNGDAHRLVRDLVRLRSYRAPPALRAAAASGWTRRWWGMLSVAVQQAVASTALGQRGPSRRVPPASRALRSTAYSTSPRPKGRAACRCGVAVACRPWAPAGPADRTGSGQEQKGVWKKNLGVLPFGSRPTPI